MNAGFDEFRDRVRLIRRCEDIERLVASAKSDLKFGSASDAQDELDSLHDEVEDIVEDVEQHLETRQEGQR